MTGPLQPGDKVLLIDGRGRRHLITLQSGGQFHSHIGIVAHDDLIGGPDGGTIRTSSGSSYTAFRPTLADYVLKMKRGAQVVYPKDVALILVEADIFPGAVVVEAGSGSGSLSLALARAVGPEGRLISYEVRADHHAQALENLKRWYEGSEGIPENVEMRSADLFAEPPQEDVDRLILDLPEPWHAVGTATEALRSGGIMCCYVPTVPQVQRIVEAMKLGGFALVNTIEGLVRSWKVDGQSVRPDHRMVAHTGFLITGRKLAAKKGT